MDLFILEDNEKYEKRCGEMFFTTKGRILFHCTLCDEKYTIFEAYLAHFMDMHLPVLENVDENEEKMETEIVSTIESIEILPTEITNENNDFDDVNEETATDECQVPDIETLDIQSGISSNKITKKSTKPKLLEIPTIVRDVQKQSRENTNPYDEERKHRCPICGVGFKELHNMTYHLKRHTNKKDNKCPQCEKTFFTMSEVKKHLRTHTQERSFLCTICGSSFYDFYFLKNHIKRHTGKKDFECKICQKSFYESSGLRNHMKVHSEIKPFVCKECNASFKIRRRLKNHIENMHSEKKQFICKICDAIFSQKNSLSAHMKAKHTEA